MMLPRVLLSAVHSFQLLLAITLLPLQLYCSPLWRDIILPIPTCALFLYYESAPVAISVLFGSSSMYWGHLIQDFCSVSNISCTWIWVTVSSQKQTVFICVTILSLINSPLKSTYLQYSANLSTAVMKTSFFTFIPSTLL